MSEVVEVSGELGNFTVKVKHNPRYIDMDKCIACGLCAQKCPRKVDDEFNQGLNQRKSAYIKYAQSIPLKYVIDGETCIYLTRGKCKACEKFCPTSAINFDDTADIATLNVGAVILSPGFKPFDPKGFDFYGYGTIPDVVTSMEYERLLSSSGPCMGHLTRPSDSKEPRRIAWIQCVGSRNTNRCANGYCSSVCCMYAIKEALVTAEHTSGGGLEQTIFFMDIRSHGKDFDRFYEGAKAKGVRFVRARPHSIEPGGGNSGVVMRYTTEDGRTLVEEFDLAVLSIGLEPPADAQQLADMFKLNLDHYRFAQTSDLAPGCTNQPGVYVAGAFQAPKVIQRSVTEASSAAAEAATALIQSRGELTRRKTYPAERSVAGDETRIGVFVCSCGINIAGVINVDEVTKYARSLPHVVLAENNLFSCSADTQELMAKKISEHRLNRVVIAACTPRTHEPLFQDTLRETGLNPYLVEMANIRNQNAWVHQREPEKATDKAKDQVRMAVAKTALSVPLASGRVNVVPKALVIGGGVAGMAAAMSLADQSFQTVLLEKSDRLGGNAWKVNATDQGEAIRPYLESLIQKVEQHPNIKVLKNAQLKTAVGSVGSFVSEIQVNGEPRAVTYGVAVLATGGRESRPDEYLYGEDPRVVTHLEFDALLRDQPAELRKAQSVAFIQCVGSRDERRPYCSRVCCTHSVKAALSLKGLNPQMNVYVLYRDMRTYGAREDLYRKARDLGVIFIRYDLERQTGRAPRRCGSHDRRLRPHPADAGHDCRRPPGAGRGGGGERNPGAGGALQVRHQCRRLPQRGPPEAAAGGHVGGWPVRGRAVQLPQAAERDHCPGQGRRRPRGDHPVADGDDARRHQVLCHGQVRRLCPVPGRLPLPRHQARGLRGCRRPRPPAHRDRPGLVQGLRPVRSHLPKGRSLRARVHPGSAQGAGCSGPGGCRLIFSPPAAGKKS